MRLTLPARTPFSLSAVVRSHGWADLAPFAWNLDAGELTRVERLASGCVVSLLVREAEGGVTVEASAPLDEAEREEVARKARWMLGLEQDYAAFYALARRAPELAHVERGAKGRLLRSPTLFEDVVKTILTTNTSWAGTVRMAGALVSRFGAALPTDPSRRAFPTPGQLAASDEEAFRSEAGLGYRAPYVLELARSVASGELALEQLRRSDLPTDQLREQLLAIKGVGDYAAAHLLILLGRYDFVPVDSWARRMVSREWYDGQPVGRAEVEGAFERWGAWQGLVYWFWDWSSA